MNLFSVTPFFLSSSLLPLGRTGQISGKEALGISSIIRKLILFYPPTIMVSVEAELLQKYLEQLVSLSCAFLRATTDATKDEDEKALFQEVSYGFLYNYLYKRFVYHFIFFQFPEHVFLLTNKYKIIRNNLFCLFHNFFVFRVLKIRWRPGYQFFTRTNSFPVATLVKPRQPL